MRIITALAIASTFLFVSCDKDDPEDFNDEELITTVRYALATADGSTTTISFTDTDGDGGNDPVIVGGTLTANTTYTGSITLLDESSEDTEDITEEVAEEDTDHQLFFSSDINDLTVTYADADSEGNPLGLATTLTTGDTGTGSITIILRHEPVKDAAGVADGDITNADGSTDVQVTIPITIE